MHAVISLLLQSRKFWWYPLLTSSILLHDVIMASYCYQRYVDCLLMTLFQQDSAATVELLREETPNSLRPICGLQTTQISVMWITSSGLSRSIVPITDKSIVWMNWNGGSSMFHAILNSRFLSRLLTSGEEDIQRVSIEDISSTACELTMFILSISVHIQKMSCLAVTSLITKSCQHRWPIHSCSFYKVAH